MNSKVTWICVGIAGLLFAFIFFVEHPFRTQSATAKSTRIFPQFDTNTATGVEIRRADHWDIRADKTNQTWQLTSPIIYPAAAAPIENLLQFLAGLNWQLHISARELRERPKVQEEFGFDAQIATRIMVQHGDSTLNLLVGANTPLGDHLYLQIVGDTGVYIVDRELRKFLPRSADDWRDRNLMPTASPFNSIKYSSGNQGFSLLYTNNSWRMVGPIQARADNAKIAELLKKAGSLQIQKFETDDPNANLEEFGLQSPKMELVFAHGTNVLAALQVGNSPTNDPAQVFARLQNQNSILRLNKELLDAWRVAPTNLIDSSLVNLSTNPIVQIDVRGEDQFTLLRKGATWTIDRATNFVVDEALVRDLLRDFNRAKVDIEKDVVTDFAPYGLEPPVLAYTLRTAGVPTNAIKAQIEFGTNQTGNVFARRLDEYPDTVKSISRDQFNRLPHASWQFRDRQVWNFGSNDVVSISIHQLGKDRKLIRNAQGDWTFAPGSQGSINTFSFAEAVYRLGDLKAVFWIAKGETDLDSFAFKEADHRILIELKRGGKTEVLPLEFGGFSEFGTRYAATMLNDVRTVFEFPWPLFFEVQDSITIP